MVLTYLIEYAEIKSKVSVPKKSIITISSSGLRNVTVSVVLLYVLMNF